MGEQVPPEVQRCRVHGNQSDRELLETVQVRVLGLGRKHEGSSPGQGALEKNIGPGRKGKAVRGAQVGRPPEGHWQTPWRWLPLSPPHPQHLQEDRDSLHTTTERCRCAAELTTDPACRRRSWPEGRPWPRPLGPCARGGVGVPFPEPADIFLPRTPLLLWPLDARAR